MWLCCHLVPWLLYFISLYISGTSWHAHYCHSIYHIMYYHYVPSQMHWAETLEIYSCFFNGSSRRFINMACRGLFHARDWHTLRMLITNSRLLRKAVCKADSSMPMSIKAREWLSYLNFRSSPNHNGSGNLSLRDGLPFNIVQSSIASSGLPTTEWANVSVLGA